MLNYFSAFSSFFYFLIIEEILIEVKVPWLNILGIITHMIAVIIIVIIVVWLGRFIYKIDRFVFDVLRLMDHHDFEFALGGIFFSENQV